MRRHLKDQAMSGMPQESRRSRKATRYWAGGGWVVLILALFLWQSISYWGVVALVAEWQFNEFGVYRPALTFFGFVVILAPLPLLFGRRRKRAVADSGAPPLELGHESALRYASRFMNVLFGVAAVAFVAALLSLVAMLMLPTDLGAVQRLTASDTLPAEPREGATELRGKILFNKTSAFDQNLWIVRRNMRFAPVIEEGADETALRYFVELPPTDALAPADAVFRRGILKRNALPGELLRLYRYAGFRVLPDHYVLFSSREPMRWPYVVMACEFAVGGMIFLLAAAIQWRRRRRLFASALAESTPPNLALTESPNAQL